MKIQLTTRKVFATRTFAEGEVHEARITNDIPAGWEPWQWARIADVTVDGNRYRLGHQGWKVVGE